MSAQQSFPPFPPWPEPAVTGLVDVTDEPIDFTPVPRQRKRRNGWTEEAQRAFIAALEQCGCVARSARSVGMSQRGVYRLLEAEGADSFAEAMDQAIARGVERVRGEAMLRALHGSWVPVVRRGRVVRMEFRHDDRLAGAILSGRDGRAIAEQRERAVSRRKYRLLLDAERREEAERRAREQAVWEEHQSVLDRIEAERENPAPTSERAPPRVRSL
ncbi:MAG TPA: hypothetical protein VFW35_12390 [Sphingomicrobium sp.]|nr:hypothetical protein [Sphingomicrobium sp.]